MKRYRFNSPNQTLFAKYSKYLYFFAAWNVLGMVLFAKVSNKLRNENPEYDKLSSQQRILYLFGYDKSNTKIDRYTIKGLTVKGEEITSKELMTPKEE